LLSRFWKGERDGSAACRQIRFDHRRVGIGRAAAQALAAEGCNVILVSRTAGDLAAAREQIR
jgi:hypothetical protein